MSESQHKEWKASWRDEYLKWICGFANAFFRAGHIVSSARSSEKIHLEIQETHQETHQETRQEITQITTQKTEQKILDILQETPEASRREIAERLVTITEDGVKYRLDKMKQEGLIKRIGLAKGGHWKVLDKKK